MTITRLAIGGLIVALLLSILVRLPALTWPLNQQADAECCGHPDEENHYEIAYQVEPKDRSRHLAGFAVAVQLAARVGLENLASWLVPVGVADPRMARGVLTARLVSLICWMFATWLLYRISREWGLTPTMAAGATGLVALSPLMQVYSIFGLPDMLNVTLILGYTWVFLRWWKNRSALALLLFGFGVGAAVGVKAGGFVGIALAIYALGQPGRRLQRMVVIVTGVLLGIVCAFGITDAHSRILTVIETFYTKSVADARVSPGWNLVHYGLSIVPSLGLHALPVLAASLWGAVGLWRAGRLRLAGPWLAIGAGCAAYLVAAISLNAPSARHLMPVFPFVAIFACAALSYFNPERRPIGSAAFLAGILVLSSAASWPVLASFRDDPNVRVAEWLRARTNATDCVLWTEYTDRARLAFSPRTDCGEDLRTARFIVAHSYWVGRFTGSWFLKPRPVAPDEIVNYDAEPVPGLGPAADLAFWNDLFAGRNPRWRIVATFGEDWWSAEQAFLALVHRGYGQFLTTGKMFVAEKAN